MGLSERTTFLLLYARSRYLPYILPAIVVVLGITAWWSHTMAPDIRNEVDREIIQRNLMSSITVLAAVSLTFSVSSPWGEMDNAAGRHLQYMRVGTLVTVTLITLALIGATGPFWESNNATWMLMRDLLGWIGITLIASKFLGENQARLVSIAWAGIAIVAGDSWRVHYPPWAWSMQDATDVWSWSIALTALFTGLVLLVKSRFETSSD